MISRQDLRQALTCINLALFHEQSLDDLPAKAEPYGRSFDWSRPAAEVITQVWERLEGLTK